MPFLQACFLHENIIEFKALYSVMSLLFGPQFEEWQNTKNIMEEAVNRVTAYRSGGFATVKIQCSMAIALSSQKILHGE